ncbi:hypothetical protein BUI56_07030 [Lactococcus lactis subsp. lactis]|uniref:hypothetical protein n=1 Tax=Lactococcus lactis TaxID=1358 RepID=UPI000200D259|nr:hypothetical protein [Lactococcus lactis]ADZ63625.1 phage protein [Lactococcus lactis subsp. lactis CV56]KAF0954312.1 hypothetical protein BUI56_07030 [Lactococcus lactis subsp. lactis]QQB11818.1 hypothetical protein I6I21_00900 [Lactococcus lactis]RQE18476.1 hypothetical protein D6114_09175 [Lactococcus lactis]RQE26100.1 hypothetical protein D6119_10020 [Lactococcus lactis]
MENGKTPKAKKPIYKRIWFWIVVVIVVAVIGSALGGGGKDKDKDSSDSKSTATSKSSSQAKTSSSSSEKPKSGWTQEIYDSVVSAKTNFNDDGTMAYSGGTPFAEIEAKVGKPDTTSESSVGDQTTVLANWTSISWTKGETQSITIQYDKATGQITSKSKFNS